MAHEAGFTAQYVLEQFPGSIAISQDVQNDYGWWTDHPTKMRYAYSFRHHMLTESVFYSKNLVVTNPWLDPAKRHSTTLAKFEEQMKRYKLVQNELKNPLAIAKTSVSGKVDKEGKVSGTFNDDLMFAVTMATWMKDTIIVGTMPNFPYKHYDHLF
jgi:hypothetical protein